METFITIYTKWFLNWGQTENAMIFILTGVTASLRYVLSKSINVRAIASPRKVDGPEPKWTVCDQKVNSFLNWS